MGAISSCLNEACTNNRVETIESVIVCDNADTELCQLLENLRAAAELQRSGDSSEAFRRLTVAKSLIEKLDGEDVGSPVHLKRSASLKQIRHVCEVDPDLQAIQAVADSASGDATGDDGKTDEEAPGQMVTVEALQDSFAQILALCRQGHIFDAAASFRELESNVEAARKSCADKGPEKKGQLQEFNAKLEANIYIQAMRATHSRMRNVLSKMGPEVMPSGEKDTRWVRCQITDPGLSADFHTDFNLRWAEGAEREKNGPSAQIIICGQLSCFPLELSRMISVYRETDLYQKEWIAHCPMCMGDVAGWERSYSALSHIVNASPMLPLALDIMTVREFSICSNAPLSGRTPGVLVLDMSPPHNAKEFAGWTIPSPTRKSIRLQNVGLVLYFVASETKPDCCDIFAFARMGAPLPQRLVPLSLVKTFLANHFISVFKAIKVHIADHWDELAYNDRIAKCPDFYGSIGRLSRDGGKTSDTADR